MAAGNNVKVGVTVTVFGIILGGVVLWLSQYNPSKKLYEIEGDFTNVGGLIAGSKVYLMGVEIGKVSATIPDLTKVKVMMNIDDNVKIPKSTRLAIAAKGLVGDKSVEFFINEGGVPNEFYKPGSVIQGNSPASFEDIIVEGRKAMQKANALIGDPELNRNIRLTSKNVEVFTRKLEGTLKQIDGLAKNVKNISASTDNLLLKSNTVIGDAGLFVGDLRNIARTNGTGINNIIRSANNLAGSLQKTADSLNQIVNDPNSRSDFRATSSSIKQAAENIQKISREATMIASDVRNVTGDKELKTNLKDIVANTKVISGSFANTLNATGQTIKNINDKDKKERLNVEFKSELMGKVNYQIGGSTGPGFDVIGNFNILTHTGFDKFPYLQLGIEEIGSKNQFNLQAGFYPFDNFRVRLGIVRGKLGVGGNYFIDKSKTEILADAYDISSPHIRIGVLQNIYQDYGLSFYWDDQFVGNYNEFVLGVRWQPSIF